MLSSAQVNTDVETQIIEYLKSKKSNRYSIPKNDRTVYDVPEQAREVIKKIKDPNVYYNYRPSSSNSGTLTVRGDTKFHRILAGDIGGEVIRKLKRDVTEFHSFTESIVDNLLTHLHNPGTFSFSHFLNNKSVCTELSPHSAYRWARNAYPRIVLEIVFSEDSHGDTYLDDLAKDYIRLSKGCIRVFVGLEVEFGALKQEVVQTRLVVWRAYKGPGPGRSVTPKKVYDQLLGKDSSDGLKLFASDFGIFGGPQSIQDPDYWLDLGEAPASREIIISPQFILRSISKAKESYREWLKKQEHVL